ncbi:regulator of G-protein signaling rgs-2-like [Lampetra fluviatilis]
MPRPVKGPSQPGGGEDSAEAEETGGAEGAGADRDACCFCWCCCCSCSCLAPQGEDSPTSSRKNSHTTRTEDCTDSEATSGRAGADEVLAWGRSFERLVRSPTGRAHFRHFLRGEFSEDNLLFWLACEELRVGTDEASLPERMRTIYEEYISILSPREVSLDSRAREAINEGMEEPGVSTFDEAQQQIYMLMQRDSYPRFLASEHYRSLLQGAPDKSTAAVSPCVDASPTVVKP